MPERFESNHPTNGLGITVTMDEDLNFMFAVYADNRENVTITPELHTLMQQNIDQRYAD